MARKNNLPPNDKNHNDSEDPRLDEEHTSDDGPEDTSFDPAALEAEVAGPPASHDPFDPAFLAMTQDFAAEAHVAKKWDVIKVEKPSKSRVFRVHPAMCLRAMLLVIKEDNESYMVLPALRQALANESLCGIYTLLPCVTKQGTPFLWPIRMADPDGKWNIWHESGWQIAEKAKARWARMVANRDAGHYVAQYDQRPPDQQQAPEWPELVFRDWLELAFRGHTIDSLDHPVLKRLRLED